MSWGTMRKGTRSEVGAALSTDFDNFAKNYPPDTLEGGDIVAARTRAMALLAAADLSDSDIVEVTAGGSHSWNKEKEHPVYANFSVKLSRISGS